MEYLCGAAILLGPFPLDTGPNSFSEGRPVDCSDVARGLEKVS